MGRLSVKRNGIAGFGTVKRTRPVASAARIPGAAEPATLPAAHAVRRGSCPWKAPEEAHQPWASCMTLDDAPAAHAALPMEGSRRARARTP